MPDSKKNRSATDLVKILLAALGAIGYLLSSMAEIMQNAVINNKPWGVCLIPALVIFVALITMCLLVFKIGTVVSK